MIFRFSSLSHNANWMFIPGFFFGRRHKNSRPKKLKLKHKKTKTQEFISKNSKIRQIFPRFVSKSTQFVQKWNKNFRKLNNFVKTQGKMSKNLNFPANPLSSKGGKMSNKEA